MKCQKCGAPLSSDHLYCDICGSEYQIVPDFEPEIEYSIAQSLPDINETIDENTAEDSLTAEPEVPAFKVPAFSIIFILVLVCSLFVYTGYHKYTHSIDYRSAKALEAINNQDYYKAAQIYKSLRKENPQNAYWYIKEADTKLMLNKPDEAYHLALLAIKTAENKESAYDFLISYMEKEKNYIEISNLLKECPMDEIRQKYWEYLCIIPTINYESGIYYESISLKFKEGFQGKIYYTLDGSKPHNGSLQYTSPIKLGNGTHIVNVIYENSYGILSEPVLYKYEINSDTPLAPDVTLDSGNYSYAEMISINVEEGTRVYYTTDSTVPTDKSKEYISPIPMPLGESCFNFVAYSSNNKAGEITTRNYNLKIDANISVEDAVALLMQKLIDTGHILNLNGSIQDRYGVFHYFYKYTISEAEQNYYVYEEHYLENQINNPLNHFYAVDVMTGKVYKMISDGSGNYTRVEF